MKRARLQGAAAVAQAFRSQATADVEVQSVGCLGQCGNGPMVVVLPEKIWYAQVTVGDVPKIVEQHLQGGKPVREKLYSKFHPHKQSRYIWLMAVGLVLGLLGSQYFSVHNWGMSHDASLEGVNLDWSWYLHL